MLFTRSKVVLRDRIAFVLYLFYIYLFIKLAMKYEVSQKCL